MIGSTICFGGWQGGLTKQRHTNCPMSIWETNKLVQLSHIRFASGKHSIFLQQSCHFCRDNPNEARQTSNPRLRPRRALGAFAHPRCRGSETATRMADGDGVCVKAAAIGWCSFCMKGGTSGEKKQNCVVLVFCNDFGL